MLETSESEAMSDKIIKLAKRSAKQKEHELEKYKIKNFTNFMENIAANVDKRVHVIKNGND